MSDLSVVAVSPLNGATGVAINSKIVLASFNKVMNPATLTSASFTLAQSGVLVPGALVTYVAAGNVAKLTLPAGNLRPSTVYTATITTAAKDATGVGLSSNFVWTFTTGTTANFSSPRVTSVVPTNGAIDVPINTKTITAAFSMAMDPASLNPASFTLTQGAGLPVSGGLVTYGVAGNVAVLRLPAGNLLPSTLYTATIATVATDVTGMSLASNYVWTFTTGTIAAITPPTVNAVVPLNNAIGVPINIRTIAATFGKAMDPTTLTPTSFTLSRGAGLLVAGAQVTYVVAGNHSMLRLPGGNLLPNTRYTATITTAATDTTGLAMVNNFTWSFTTGVTQDNTPPRVIATDVYGPAGTSCGCGATDIPVNRSSIAIFSESMDALSITTPPAFRVVNTTLGGIPVAGSVIYDASSRTATFTPSVDYTPFTLYTSMITTAATDLAGNALSVDYVWSWITGNTPDTIRPTVLLTAPLNAAASVSLNQSMSATFSEVLDPSTINNLAFTLTGAGFTQPGGFVSYDPMSRIATFAPLTNLAPLTTYTVTLTSGFADLAGNALEGNQLPAPPSASNYLWRFTTGNVPARSAVDLGLAYTFAVAASAGIINTITAPISHINGDVVLNPIATCNALSVFSAGGFGFCFATPPTLNGRVITPSYPDATTAQSITDDLRAAYLGITPANMPGATPLAAPTTLGAPTAGTYMLGDSLFYPGVYQSTSSIEIAGFLTLDAQGDANATFVFQSASTLGTAPNTRILLLGGAKASNIWWQVGSDVTLRTNTLWQGNILAHRDITMLTSAASCGRLFAGASTDGTLVLDANVVSVPGHSNAPADCQ